MEHHRLEELGYNLACLIQAGTGAALTVTAVGLTLPRHIVGAIFGEPHHECGCHARHRDRCCYIPPLYGC